MSEESEPFAPLNVEGEVLVYMMPSTARRFQDAVRREGSFLMQVGSWQWEGGHEIPVLGIGMTQQGMETAIYGEHTHEGVDPFQDAVRMETPSAEEKS